MRVVLVLLLCVALCGCAWGENYRIRELPDGNYWIHVFTDCCVSDGGYAQYAHCIHGQNHLFIDLSQRDFNRILGADPDFKRATYFSASICIKCRPAIDEWEAWQQNVRNRNH